MFEWKVYLSANGRLSRRTWWLAMIVPCVILFVLVFLVAVLENGQNVVAISIFAPLLEIPLVAALIVIAVKRFHDIGKSGWYCLIALVPLLGWLVLLVPLGFVKGTVGPNKYGEGPLPTDNLGKPEPGNGTNQTDMIK